MAYTGRVGVHESVTSFAHLSWVMPDNVTYRAQRSSAQHVETQATIKQLAGGWALPSTVFPARSNAGSRWVTVPSLTKQDAG